MHSEDPSVEDILLDSLALGILLFDGHDDLIKTNKCAAQFLSRACPEEIILTLSDFKKAFNLSQTGQTGAVEKFETIVNGVFFEIIFSAAHVPENLCTLIQMRNISGEKKQIATVHKQTSDLLWKIRSRITPVQNALTLLTDYGMEAAETAELLKNSQFEIGELEGYLDTFRDMSLIVAGALDQSLVIEKIDLYKAVDTAISNIAFFRNYIGKNCSITNSVDKKLRIMGDKQRTTRIIESLVLNAIIYSGESVTVAVSASEREDGLCLEIKDNGFGISDADQPGIFSYGFRGKNALKTDYCGMGCELYVARRILSHANASLSFTSKENEGATFEICFKKKAS
jgi:signal transduction histidine kinase